MPEPLKQSFTAMACDCEVQVHAADQFAAEAAAAAVVAEVRRIEAKYSRYRPHSILSQINGAAGLATTVIDPETTGLLDYGAACWEQSGGAFDLTSGVLRRAWDFRDGRGVPTQKQLDALLPLVGWDKVRWHKPDLFLTRRSMELDLGGVAKEYAADTAAAAGLRAGASVCLVNLGGDVRVTGPHPDGRPWRVGIRHPRRPDSLAAWVMISSGGLATSGDYERAVIRDGIRYCHILDPRTGWPVPAAPSVTVAAPVCMVAGSLSTMAMLAGAEAATLLEDAGLPWLLVDEAGQGRGPLAGKD